MTDDQRSRVAALKTVIAATATPGAGTPADVRAMVVALKQELRREGITARAFATSIGVHESSLCHWERDTIRKRRPMVAKMERSRGAGFRRVHVAEAVATRTVTPASSLSVQATITSGRGFRVAHAPSGLVVDGLDVETLAALLKRMS